MDDLPVEYVEESDYESMQEYARACKSIQHVTKVKNKMLARKKEIKTIKAEDEDHEEAFDISTLPIFQMAARIGKNFRELSKNWNEKKKAASSNEKPSSQQKEVGTFKQNRCVTCIVQFQLRPSYQR